MKIYFLTFFLGVNNDCNKFDATFFFLLLFFGLFDLLAIKAVAILFILFDLLPTIAVSTLYLLFNSFAESAEFVLGFGFGPGFAFGFLDVFNFINALAASLFDTILLFHYKIILSRLSFSSNSIV